MPSQQTGSAQRSPHAAAKNRRATAKALTIGTSKVPPYLLFAPHPTSHRAMDARPEGTTTSVPRAGGPVPRDYAGPSLLQMAASTLGVYPLSPPRLVIAQDAAVLACMGALATVAPATFIALANAVGGALGIPAALVVKSDTSLLLLKVVGATQLAFAASIMWRMCDNAAAEGVGLLRMQAVITPLLLLMYATGGPVHGLLMPVIAHNLATIAGLLWTTPNPLRKALRAYAAGPGRAA